MSKRIGVHLRVTGHTSQGGRKYMEDCFSVAYQHTEDQSDLEYAYFGIFDGHGGSEAASFAKNHLMDYIVSEKDFWSDNDNDVLSAIRQGFIKTHNKMWKIQGEWPKTQSGLPSTAGTTASIAFVRHGKIYTGHVGDSGIILGFQTEDNSPWQAIALTQDHKPESVAEKARIENNGGKVISKSGVPRVVWNKPRLSEGHKGPIQRDGNIDEIPFLAVARSLGDLWSYNPENNVFIVSPEPDVAVKKIDVNRFRCLLFGTDGLWNVLSPQQAVTLVENAEKTNKAIGNVEDKTKSGWINPSKRLVEEALLRWSNTRMRADNTTVVTLMLDPPARRNAIKTIKPDSVEPLNSQSICDDNTVLSQDDSGADLASIVTSLEESEESMDMEEIIDDSESLPDDEANLSILPESLETTNDEENLSTVYADLTNVGIEEVLPGDDDDQTEHYDRLTLPYDREYITNVIFGPLFNKDICPEIPQKALEVINNTIEANVLPQETIENSSDSSCKDTCDDTEQEETAESKPEVMDQISTEISNLITKDIKQVLEEEDTGNLTKIIKNDPDCSNIYGLENESIQIHEISSSCMSRSIHKTKTRFRKTTKRPSLEILNQSESEEKLLSDKISNRKSFRISSRRKSEFVENEKYRTITKISASDFGKKIKSVKFRNVWYPVIVLKDCSKDEKLTLAQEDNSKENNSVPKFTKTSGKRVPIKKIGNIKKGHSMMSASYSKGKIRGRTTRSRTKTA